jgi:hypothetical protein
MRRNVLSWLWQIYKACSLETERIVWKRLIKMGIRERQCAYKCNIAARSPNHLYRGKAISIIYSEYVSVALVIQHAMRMRRTTHVVNRGLSGSTIFSHIISQKARFSKNVTEHKMCVLSFLLLLSETFLLLRRIQWDIIINEHRSSCKVWWQRIWSFNVTIIIWSISPMEAVFHMRRKINV